MARNALKEDKESNSKVHTEKIDKVQHEEEMKKKIELIKSKRMIVYSLFFDNSVFNNYEFAIAVYLTTAAQKDYYKQVSGEDIVRFYFGENASWYNINNFKQAIKALENKGYIKYICFDEISHNYKKAIDLSNWKINFKEIEYTTAYGEKKTRAVCCNELDSSFQGKIAYITYYDVLKIFSVNNMYTSKVNLFKLFCSIVTFTDGRKDLSEEFKWKFCIRNVYQLAECCDVSVPSVIKYVQILKDNKIIAVAHSYKTAETITEKNSFYKATNVYCRYEDRFKLTLFCKLNRKDNLLYFNAANRKKSKAKSKSKEEVNSKRSMTQKVRLLMDGKRYSKDEVADLYWYAKQRNDNIYHKKSRGKLIDITKLEESIKKLGYEIDDLIDI